MKYLTKKIIKGHPYYYLQYQGYSKNLGRFLPKDLKKVFLNFFLSIASKEYEALPTPVKREFRFGNLKGLEKLHYWHICLNHDLFLRDYLNFYERFSILFSYHSNRSEGSQISQGDFENFSKKKIRVPKTKTTQEIFNSFRALNFAFSKDMKWNMKHVKTIHALLLEDLDPLIAGNWKNENNVAPGNHPTTDHRKVKEQMKKLMEWLNLQFKKDVYPPLLAVRFYCRFERIHPFLDGNGRVGRILLNAILHKFHYPPVIFFTENHKEHSGAIKQALGGRWEKFLKHFLTQVKKTDQAMQKIIKD